MPYIIVPVGNGYKVCKKNEPTRCFSKAPIPKARAEKQRIAIILSEKR